MKHSYIIIFDGPCNLCSSFVDFIIKRDPHALFSFTPMQTDIALSLMSKYRIDPAQTDSVVLIKDGVVYLRADAIFEILKDLKGFWSVLRIFKVLPAGFTDYIYRYIAKNRYRMFGRSPHCMMPSAQMRSRFLMDSDKIDI